MDQNGQKGEISVTTEHIFPIIKRWLYSDKDIFLREIVSNASDAITKLSRLRALNEAPEGEAGRIDVLLDGAAGTLTVRDNGIGMTREEVERYLNQIALSGALEFVEKYEGESGGEGIIGHFGLGFYSAFMVASQVTVVTKSYTEAPAVEWICTEDGSFEMKEGARESVGTDVILKLSEEEREYLKRDKILSILEKYCAFLSYPIYLTVAGEEKKEEENPVNDTSPAWMKPASEVTEEDYRALYAKLFGYSSEPLFWVHLNADYPLNFKGILYFPRLKNQFDSMEGEVKLFYNRVFVADNISEVVPEYLLSLKGVLDCPELPLNVSRSFLQTSPYVAKLSAHIAKKVADKLAEIFRTERDRFESFSQDLRPFLEYGAIKDQKFFTRIRDLLLFETTDGEHLSLSEYLGEGEEKTVYYTTDPVCQAQYIRLLKNENKRVICLDSVLDTQYISFLENEEQGLSFVRVDSDSAPFKTKAETQDEALRALFSGLLKEGETVEFAELADAETPALFVCEEQERRFRDMMRAYQARGGVQEQALPEKQTLCVNLACPLCETLRRADGQTAELLAKQIYYTALIAARPLKEEELSAFLENNYQLMSR